MRGFTAARWNTFRGREVADFDNSIKGRVVTDGTATMVLVAYAHVRPLRPETLMRPQH